MSWQDITNLLASITSLVLSGLAIWLSIVFYNRSKDTERRVETTLEAIKTQVRALERITSKQLDKYTDYATGPKPVDETVVLLAGLLSQYVPGNIQKIGELPSGDTDEEQMARYISAVIGFLYYAGVSNIAMQSKMFEAKDDQKQTLKGLIDSSKSDFETIEGVLDSIEQTLLEASQNHQFLMVSKDTIKPLLRSSSELESESENFSDPVLR